jgi:hypothetical protein
MTYMRRQLWAMVKTFNLCPINEPGENVCYSAQAKIEDSCDTGRGG